MVLRIAGGHLQRIPIVGEIGVVTTFCDDSENGRYNGRKEYYDVVANRSYSVSATLQNSHKGGTLI